jgi:glycosyltransferase involved in cell wall biosynthesis
MVIFNLISRIAVDKDFFEPLLHSLGKLNHNISDRFKLNIIGDINDENIFIKLEMLTSKLSIADNVSFTKKSIGYKDLDKKMLDGYFLNFSIGQFVGYSTIEAIDLGLKTIVINADIDFEEVEIKDIWYCNKIDDFYNLATEILKDEDKLGQKIIKENMNLKNNFFLTHKEADFLLNLL